MLIKTTNLKIQWLEAVGAEIPEGFSLLGGKLVYSEKKLEIGESGRVFFGGEYVVEKQKTTNVYIEGGEIASRGTTKIGEIEKFFLDGKIVKGFLWEPTTYTSGAEPELKQKIGGEDKTLGNIKTIADRVNTYTADIDTAADVTLVFNEGTETWSGDTVASPSGDLLFYGVSNKGKLLIATTSGTNITGAAAKDPIYYNNGSLTKTFGEGLKKVGEYVEKDDNDYYVVNTGLDLPALTVRFKNTKKASLINSALTDIGFLVGGGVSTGKILFQVAEEKTTYPVYLNSSNQATFEKSTNIEIGEAVNFDGSDIQVFTEKALDFNELLPASSLIYFNDGVISGDSNGAKCGVVTREFPDKIQFIAR